MVSEVSFPRFWGVLSIEKWSPCFCFGAVSEISRAFVGVGRGSCAFFPSKKRSHPRFEQILRVKGDKNISFILVGNKADLARRRQVQAAGHRK